MLRLFHPSFDPQMKGKWRALRNQSSSFVLLFILLFICNLKWGDNVEQISSRYPFVLRCSRGRVNGRTSFRSRFRSLSPAPPAPAHYIVCLSPYFPYAGRHPRLRELPCRSQEEGITQPRAHLSLYLPHAGAAVYCTCIMGAWVWSHIPLFLCFLSITLKQRVLILRFPPSPSPSLHFMSGGGARMYETWSKTKHFKKSKCFVCLPLHLVKSLHFKRRMKQTKHSKKSGTGLKIAMWRIMFRANLQFSGQGSQKASKIGFNFPTSAIG